MLSKFSGFFQDTGNLSMTRLLSFISIIVASFIAGYAIVNNRDLSATAILVGSFLGPAFFGKAYQSKVEHENEK
jgi:hypothetical protein